FIKSFLNIIIYFEVVSLDKIRVIVSVIGKEQVGIIEKVTNLLSYTKINILDIRLTMLKEFFTTIMVVDMSGYDHIYELQQQFNDLGKKMNLKINIQLEEIFQAMHRV